MFGVGGDNMYFPKMSSSPSYKVSVPELSGGINTNLALNMINDNQLTDAKNVWFSDGALRTRPGISANTNVLELQPNTVPVAQDWITVGAAYQVKTDAVYVKDGITYKLLAQISNNTTQCIIYFRLVSTLIIDLPAISVSYALHSKIEDIVSFSYNDTIYVFIPGDKGYKLNYSSNTWSWVALTNTDYYAPLIMMGSSPVETLHDLKVTGTMNESSNIMTPFFRSQFTTNGVNGIFGLPEKNLGNYEIKVEWLKSNGTTVTFIIPANASQSEFNSVESKYCNVYKPYGAVWFSTDLEGDFISVLDASGVANNITITAGVSDFNNSKILNMKTCEWFGGTSAGISGGTRLFVGGNSECPHMMYWSGADNPLYFPENNYVAVGKSQQSITAFGKQSNMLVIFKEREIYYVTYTQGNSYTAEDLQNYAVIDTEVAAAQFYLIQIHGYIGCDCPNTIQLCKNRLVWATSNRKVYTLTDNSQYSERNVYEISYNISRKLDTVTESEMKMSCSADYDNHYLLAVGNRVFVLNYSGTGFTYVSSYYSGEKAQKSTTWYYWELPSNVDCMWIKDSDLKLASTTYISQISKCYQAIYTLIKADTADTIIKYTISGESASASAEPASISTMIQTKLFDFNSLNQYKNIQSVFLGIGSNEENVLNVSFITERGTNENARSIALNEPNYNYSPEFIKVIKLNPCQPRTLEFGLRIDSEGSMAVGSMTIIYRLLGGVK